MKCPRCMENVAAIDEHKIADSGQWVCRTGPDLLMVHAPSDAAALRERLANMRNSSQAMILHVDETPTMFMLGATLWPGLSKLIEEMGEVHQVCGKLIGTQGKEEHWDGTNLREWLRDELADLQAAINFVMGANYLDTGGTADDNFHRRVTKKIALFEEWHQKERR